MFKASFNPFESSFARSVSFVGVEALSLRAEVVQECIAARLRALNEGAVGHFKRNLNHYDEKKGEFSFTKLAKVYTSYWQDNEQRMQVEVQAQPDALYQLVRVPDKICLDQQLKDLQDCRAH